MKKILVAAMVGISAIASIGPAFANKDHATWDPPAPYNRPYTGKLTVHKLPPKMVTEVCARLFAERGRKLFSTNKQRGCAVSSDSDRACTVVIIDRYVFGTTPEAVLRHELGHCNGWPSHHPE